MITKLDSKRLFLIQEYLGDRKGIDLRVLVLRGRVLGAMKRSSSNGDFRSGITGGGSGEKYRVTPEIIETCETIARLMKLELCGVDLLWQGKHMAISEVNSAPGFHGFDRYCHDNIAAKIASYVKERLNSNPPLKLD
jgi:glutathione synthase/RimK-type ligase-like ATP-grasp enzyme